MARRMNGRVNRFAPTGAAPGTADALIAGAYLAGTNTRRVRRALKAVFAGGSRQGCREPDLAEGERRLGCMKRPLADVGTNHNLSRPLTVRAFP